MSNLSKVVLVAASGFAIGIIVVVHWSQDADRKRLREGVQRDLERQKMKKNDETKKNYEQNLTVISEELRINR